jgi:serine protease inhibitor
MNDAHKRCGAWSGPFVVFAILAVLAVAPGFAEEIRHQNVPTAQGTGFGIDPADPLTLLDAQLRLGSNLVGSLAGSATPSRNIIISPASLAMVMGTLDIGASDDMRAAIQHTIGFTATSNPTRDLLAGVRSSASSILQLSSKAGTLGIANVIVFDPSSRPSDSAARKLAAAEVEVAIDDLSDPEVISRMNAWVEDRTRGHIPSVLHDAPLDAGLVAINALYSKGRWKLPFNLTRTRSENFYPAGGEAIIVPMMHCDGHFSFRRDSQFTAVELSYAEADYKLVVVTCRGAPSSFSELAEASSWLGGEGFRLQAGELSLPRFSMSHSEDLLPAVDALGLAVARKAPEALIGFGAQQTIAQLIQKTEILVNEEGTEATAATAAMTSRSATFTNEYVKMIVDKPFIFALRDQSTGFVLIEGYVARPSDINLATAN